MAEGGCVVGVDIDAGSSPSSLSQPKYSIAVLSSDGILIHRAEGVGLRGLVRRLWKYRPSILAVDNVYELAGSRGELLRLVRTLPPGVKLVQVTGHPRSPRPLFEVAASRGLEAPSKPTPLQTAVLCAKLALMGEGYEARLLEPEVRIVVSRARSLGPGGMSHDRFKRDARSQVLQATREICDALKSRGVDYDLFIRGSRQGPDRSLIVVYASRSELREVVKPYEGRGVKVKVYEPPTGGVEFVPRQGSSPKLKQGRYLIVGVDPGMVTGLAILDLEGRPLLLTSRRGMDRLALSRLILDHGSPLIVASDVNPPPTLVEKLSSMLNAVLHVPSSTLTVDEKRRLTADFEGRHGLRARDSHQRDALAAALKAYMHYRNKFEQVDSHVRSMNVKVPLEEVKALVVRGVSVQEAVRRLASQPSQPPKPPLMSEERLKAEVKALQEKLASQRCYVEKLEAERARLLSRLEELSRRVAELEASMEKLRREQSLKVRESLEVRKLEAQLEGAKLHAAKLEGEVGALKARLEELEGVLAKWLRGEVRPLKPLNALTPSGVAEGVERFKVGRGDVVFVKDAASASSEAVETLAKLKVEGVVSSTRIHPDAKRAFIRHQLAFLESPELEVEWVGGVPFVEPHKLASLLSEAKRRVEEEGLKQAKAALMDALIKYRLQRERELTDRNPAEG